MPSLTPVTADFLDNAPVRVVRDVTIAAAPSDCWKAIADQTSWPSWFDGLELLATSQDTWTTPGDTRTVKVNGLKVNERAISVEPEKEYAFTILKWPLAIASSAAEAVRLADVGTAAAPATKLTYIGAFEPNWIGKLVMGLLEKKLGSAWEGAFNKLATQLS